MGTLTPTSDPTEAYSLYGAWNSFDDQYAMKLSIDQMCQFVKFEFVTPGCNESWFGVGFGANYSLIVKNEEVYERNSMQRQMNQNLRDCAVEIVDCVQYTVCYRDFMTDDSENDYYLFREGVNDIIVAHGFYDNVSFVNAYQSAIYLNGKSICLTQTTDNIDTTDEIEKNVELLSNDREVGIWQAIGIVFIILFVFAMLFLFYKIYQERHSAPKGYVNRMGSFPLDEQNISPRQSDANELGVLNTVVDEEDD